MDVTEIFNRADAERQTRSRKLAFLGFVEVITAYKITYAAVHALMTTAGREALAKVPIPPGSATSTKLAP